MSAAFLERWPIGLPRVVAAGAVVLGLAALGLAIWQWQQDVAQASLRGPAPVTSTADAVDPLPVILSGNLFGSAATPTAATGAVATRVATGYTLRAAFAAVAGSGGGAIIEATGSEARWYATGESLEDGAKLHEVHSDHVVFDRAGVLERLDFPKLEQLAVVSAAAGEPGSQSSAGEPIPADASPEEKAQIIRQRLEELRNRSRT